MTIVSCGTFFRLIIRSFVKFNVHLFVCAVNPQIVTFLFNTVIQGTLEV